MLETILAYFTPSYVPTPFHGLWFVLTHGGWLILGIFLIRFLWWLWVFELQNAYWAAIPRSLIAIHVPKEIEDSPKAAENMFEYLRGLRIKRIPTLYERYWIGEIQPNFSCEIVSKGGTIQFYMWIPKLLRNVVESAVYAQYPDAEITEVEHDYVYDIPQKYPDPDYDLWGSEMALDKSWVYPIKTYERFEDKLEGVFKDPLANLFEFMSSLHPGEQAWVQIAILPIENDWHHESMHEVKKLIGAPVHEKTNIIRSFLGFFGRLAHDTIAHFFGVLYEEDKHTAKDEPPSLMLYLSPGEKTTVEEIQLKASKNGFLCKIRVAYAARKELFNKYRVASGLYSSFFQFNNLECNSFKPDKRTLTKAEYAFIEWRKNYRKNKLIAGYRARSMSRGYATYVFNTEELASLWHFPTMTTPSPLVSKAESKKSEPPHGLPIAYSLSEQTPSRPKKEKQSVDPALPENLPFV